MTTLDPGFRRLVFRHLPKLSREELNRYEGLIALRWQLIQELSLARDILVAEPKDQPPHDYPRITSEPGGPPGKGDRKKKGKVPMRPYGELPDHEAQAATPRDKLEAMIEETTKEANAILERFRKEYDALHELWLARRRLALQYGGLLQIPATGEGLMRWFVSLTKYYGVQIRTFPTLFKNRLKNFSAAQWVALVALAGLVALGASSLRDFEPAPPDNGNPPPDSTAVRLRE